MAEQATYNRQKVLALVEERNLLADAVAAAYRYIHSSDDKQENYTAWRTAYDAWAALPYPRTLGEP